MTLSFYNDYVVDEEVVEMIIKYIIVSWKKQLILLVV